MRFGFSIICGLTLASWGSIETGAGELSPNERREAIQRGRNALIEKSYSPSNLNRSAYDNVWKEWGLKEKPSREEYARLFRDRYGLHSAPYENNGLPMGLKEATGFLGFGKVIAQDCLICHGGSIAGKSYIGLGNASLDYQAFYEEMTRASGSNFKTPFRFTNVRGTSEAGGMAVFLLGYRTPELQLRVKPLDLELHDDLCEDPPAWWLLKKKQTMYHTGSADTRSVRSLMQFMMSPLNPPSAFTEAEPEFRDIREFLLSLEPPRYPFAVDKPLAARGEKLFRAHCARCHGTYGEEWTYPNRIIPLDEIGTDGHRLEGITRKFGEYYAQSWFAKEVDGWFTQGYLPIEADGYQAPPLDGLWATGPYFHNGSVPTVYHVLNSKSRPRVFTRSYATDADAYDSRLLGWKIKQLPQGPDPSAMDPIEARKIYDTALIGRGNQGHTFGDHLSDGERFAIIEYLKTL